MKNSFEKLIFLPSGGLLYSPFVLVRPITNDFLLFQSDNNLFDSVFDYQLAVLRRYTDSETHIMKLSTQDFFYVWMYLYVNELEEGTGVYLSGVCSDCKKENQIYMDVDKFNVNIMNKFQSRLVPTVSYSAKDMELTFRIRLVEDNIFFGNLLLNSEHNEQDWYLLALYIATQLSEMKLSGHIVPEEHYLDVLLFNLHYGEILEAYSVIKAFESQFGIDSRVHYFCQHCQKPQSTVLYDNIMNSIIASSDMKKMTMFQENVMDDALHMARYKLLNFNEYMEKMPIKYSKIMKTVIDRMEFTPMI